MLLARDYFEMTTASAKQRLNGMGWGGNIFEW